ncbi:hypothetical protein [Hymenobacter psychrophilus]|uniref:DUF3887 domain-containing protein n=1 Tax=Hymenobacter psychrophilus TaxID=651662 RepID=A0A1H3EFF3_9BACT|nr:hypothetical protein [Hymenobacter psychrophilus]SDX77347.1 hypothetical protein SAMN04488069_103119 [Hymenobacter psychrophilus]
MRVGAGVLRIMMVATGLLLLPGSGPAQQRPLSQVQVARRFWLAAVGQHWQQAYRWLTPTARAQLSERQFRQTLQPLREPVRQFGPIIDLYKLGYRLRDVAAPEPFVAYTFRADTLAARPHFQLDISFQDSTARQVKSFRLIQMK